MVEKRPEFTGPLVNSWPGRLLTLEIARFSVISWDPKKCRNPYFCSIISFAYTRPLKLDPQKRGSKNFVFDRAVSKKRPPPDRLLTLPFGAIKKSGEKQRFPIFGFSFFGPFFFFFVFGFVRRRKIILKICATLPGWPKNREKQGFFCLSSWQIFLVVVFFHVVSLCSCFSSCTFFVANV